ncbi:unnamed protein product [Brassica rapa subsp. trilocularis]
MNPSSFRSKSTIDVDEAIKNQNDIAMVVSKDLFSSKAKHSNSVFSPASINNALNLAASGPSEILIDGSSFSSEILSFLRASSTDDRFCRRLWGFMKGASRDDRFCGRSSIFVLN